MTLMIFITNRKFNKNKKIKKILVFNITLHFEFQSYYYKYLKTIILL